MKDLGLINISDQQTNKTLKTEPLKNHLIL